MLPDNPVMLLSVINMKLRDQYDSLDSLCDDLDVNKELNDNSIQKNGTFENCLDILSKKAEKKNQQRKNPS